MVTVRVRLVGTSIVSNAITYGYSQAVVDSVSPVTGGTGGGTLVDVVGRDLGIFLNNVTEQGCVAQNQVWLGPWPCVVEEVRVCGV